MTVRGKTDGPLSYIAEVALEEGMAVNVDWSYANGIGLVNKAFDEDAEILIVQTAVAAGDAVVCFRPENNRSFFTLVLDTGVKGAALYLDTQANQAAATGKFKFTAGTATKQILTAMQTAAAADCTIVTIFGDSLPAPMTFSAEVDVLAGMALNVDWSTALADGLVNKAFDEDAEILIAITDASAGELVECYRPQRNRVQNAYVLDAGSKGDVLYLDLQANQGAATGKFKFTAGTATVKVLNALEAVTVANSTIRATIN